MPYPTPIDENTPRRKATKSRRKALAALARRTESHAQALAARGDTTLADWVNGMADAAWWALDILERAMTIDDARQAGQGVSK